MCYRLRTVFLTSSPPGAYDGVVLPIDHSAYSAYTHAQRTKRPFNGTPSRCINVDEYAFSRENTIPDDVGRKTRQD